MKLFFDTEFTDLKKDCDLISIGIVTELGNEFYAEITDYDKSKLSDFSKKNVLPNLRFDNNTLIFNQTDFQNQFGLTNIYMRGSKQKVANELKNWLSSFGSLQFISDVCHYDVVLLVDLLGNTKGFVPVCHDINMDIAKSLGISVEAAFDKNRERLAEYTSNDNDKHNSLYDAKIIKSIYDKFN